MTKEIPIADLKLSASAHRDNGAEVCVGGFMFYQYTKYEEELRRKAQVMQLSSSSNGGGLDLAIGGPLEKELFPGTNTGGVGVPGDGKE